MRGAPATSLETPQTFLGAPCGQGVLSRISVGGRWLGCPMSTTYTEPLARLEGGLDDLSAIGPEFRTTGEKQELLVGLSRLIARARPSSCASSLRPRCRRGHRRPVDRDLVGDRDA